MNEKIREKKWGILQIFEYKPKIQPKRKNKLKIILISKMVIL
jgi:hypothetical protein